MYQEVTDRLDKFISNHLPLVVSMGAQIQRYDGAECVVSAPLSLNYNDKGNGFGGSLYCLCITNAIGLLFLKCFEQGLNPDLVVSKAEISYLKPVASATITSHCSSPGEPAWRDFFGRYRASGKASIALQARIVQDHSEAVLFSGRFAIIGESDTT